MHFPEETLYYLLFILSPVLAVISAVFVGFTIYEVISIFKNTIMTRFLKVLLVPIAIFIYLMNYVNNIFDFDFWFEAFLSGGGWDSLSTGQKFLITGPIIIGVIYLAIKYIIGWGSESKVELDQNIDEDHNK